MEPGRFDRISRSIGRRFSRRRALHGICAAGVAGAVAAVRQQSAAADCEDAWMHCGSPRQGGAYVDVGAVGYAGRCWNWSKIVCEVCPGASLAAAQRCNETYPQDCQGRCFAYPVG